MKCELQGLHSFSLYVGACVNVSGEPLEYCTLLCGGVPYNDV